MQTESFNKKEKFYDKHIKNETKFAKEHIIHLSIHASEMMIDQFITSGTSVMRFGKFISSSSRWKCVPKSSKADPSLADACNISWCMCSWGSSKVNSRVQFSGLWTIPLFESKDIEWFGNVNPIGGSSEEEVYWERD